MRWFLFALLLLGASPSRAQAVLTLTGPASTATLTRADLDALPPGPPQAHLAGPTLLSVLQRAGLLNPDFHGRVRQVLTVTGEDGYSVALAMAEIDPEFEDKPVLLALHRDDTTLDIRRLAVPGDKRAGRSVRDVVKIELQ